MRSTADFAALLRQTMGLDASTIGTATVERALRDRLAALRLMSLDDYWEIISGSADEFQELIESVIVPETWFFRDAEAFRTLVRVARENAGREILRVLSIPCSTGEEPYSIAMALSDEGFPPSQTKVDAVDISARSLQQARRAVYGRNSFRGENVEFRDRHFRREGRAFALKEEIQQAVRFYPGNLVLNTFPRPSAPYNIIFCRNVLVYFDSSTQESVLRTLASLLVADGALFVGSAEAYLAVLSGFTSINDEMSFAFRKAIKPPATPVRPVKVRKPLRPLSARKELKIPELAAASPAEGAPIEEARRLADLGRLSEAIRCCETVVDRQPGSAEAYHLMGVLEDAAGDRRRAAECYRRAIYLDPEHVEALTHLALLVDCEGDRNAAERFRERARRVAERNL